MKVTMHEHNALMVVLSVKVQLVWLLSVKQVLLVKLHVEDTAGSVEGTAGAVWGVYIEMTVAF